MSERNENEDNTGVKGSSEVSGGVSLSLGGASLSDGGVSMSGGGVSMSGGGVSMSGGGQSRSSGGGYASGGSVGYGSGGGSNSGVAYGIGGGISIGGGVSLGGGYGSGSGGVGYGGGVSVESSRSVRSSYKPISQSRSTFKDYQKKVSVAPSAQVVTQSNPGLALLSASNISMHNEVDSAKKGRSKEKKDLQDLNERFASYIEKARFLEAQNKSLVVEIEMLKGGSTNDNSKIKEMYEVELKELRRLLNESEKSKGPLELKIHGLEAELEDILIRFRVLENTNTENKVTIDRQRKEIMNLESELVQLRRSRSSYDEDSTKFKDEIDYMKDDLKKTKADFEREALARINFEHDLQTLQETLEFERQVNETEVKNLSGVAFRDTTKENQAFWQNEMGRALRDIQGEYENKLIVMKQEIEANYGLQLQEVRTSKTRENVETSHLREENTRIKTNVQGMKSRMSELEMKVAEYEMMMGLLRGELEEYKRDYELQRLLLQEELTTTKSDLTHTLAELQSILDAKLGLELEICAYRKLLEFEETRINASGDGDNTLSQFISFVGGDGSDGRGSTTRGGVTVSGGSSGGVNLSFGGGSGGGVGLSLGGRSVGGISLSSGGGSGGGVGLSFGGGSGGGLGLSSGGGSGVGVGSSSGGGSGGGVGLSSGGGSGGGVSLSSGGGSGGGVGLSLGGGSGDGVGFSVGGGLSVGDGSSGVESEKVKFRRTTKGNISIAEIDINGEVILLENVGTSAEHLDGMILKRTIDGVVDKIVYTIPSNTSLRAGQKLRICANGKKTGKGKELEIDETSWGTGDAIFTTLYTAEDEPKAQHIQEIVR